MRSCENDKKTRPEIDLAFSEVFVVLLTGNLINAKLQQSQVLVENLPEEIEITRRSTTYTCFNWQQFTYGILPTRFHPLDSIHIKVANQYELVIR
jgi:glucose dehydrogenase